MEWNVTKKALLTLGLICILLAMVPASAFSWGDATHAYIADKLRAPAGYYNLNEMWGSLGPDIFNFIFDDTLCPLWLAEQTHGTPTVPDSFLKVWDAANGPVEKALAYGFVSHNELWGADFTAHLHGQIIGQDEGYINAKAIELLGTVLDPTQPYDPPYNPTFAEVFAGMGASPQQQLIIAHVIAEYAIDIMLKNQVDHLLGQKIKSAARFRSPKFPALLVDAYAADYADKCSGIDSPTTAAAIITYAEAEYRRNMISYGQAISRPQPIAVQLIAEQIVALAPGFLGGPLPDLEVDPVEIVKAAIYGSMAICRGDYMTEIDATILFVEKNLAIYESIY